MTANNAEAAEEKRELVEELEMTERTEEEIYMGEGISWFLGNEDYRWHYFYFQKKKLAVT